MADQKTNFDLDIPTNSPGVDVFLPFPFSDVSGPAAVSGLSGHVRRLQRKNQGLSRWLVLALLGGVAVAFVMVQFAIR
jgi:hypothetical protein